MNKLRLAVFNTQPPHLYFGGVERRIIETAKRMGSEIEATVYSGTKAGFTRPTKMNGATLVPCFSTDSLFPVDNWFFNHTISRAFSSIEADVFEAHAVSGYGIQRALRKRNSKKPFVQTVHGVLADEYFQALQAGSLSLRGKLANLMMWRLSKLEGECARNADLVVTISDYSREKLAQLYDVDKSKVRIVPNGVDTERFKPSEGGEELKRRIGLGNRPIVLFVGRLIPRKGLSYLIEAAKVIVRECRDVVFLIVGDGPLRDTLVSHVGGAGLSENFLFVGDVREALIPSLYNCADIFVLPSIQEGQGIALLEAQASEKPVVAFNTGGVREALKDEETGLLTEVGSQSLANALLRLLHDEFLREKMGRQGRDFVSSTLSWDVCARKMVEVYREAKSLA